MKPKISIIMPTYNQGQYIERAIKSVVNQNYSNWELIIIDNESSDETPNIIEKYKSFISIYLCEKDTGQSNALNKGFKIASGELVTWLNSDDILLPETLFNVSRQFQQNSSIEWYVGNVVWIDKFDKILRIRKGEKYNSFLANNYFAYAYGPSSFFSKSLLMKYGFLREDMHYMMDTELWYRFLKNNVKFKRLNFYCWGLRLHEEAKMSGHNFAESKMNDVDHPSKKQKEIEKNLLNKDYYDTKNRKITAWFFFYFFKLFSFNVFKGHIDNLIYSGKDVRELSNIIREN